ncbi:MAG: hypothetical protein R3C12_02350 [Planctomycetaceae bacterium]|nr:hypothetical protein [Planctomycetaceae bacterium]
MRFGDPPTPAPYLNAKDQRRLLGLVLTLSFVVLAVTWAARPESWYWLIPPDNDTATNDPAPVPSADSGSLEPRIVSGEERDGTPPAFDSPGARETDKESVGRRSTLPDPDASRRVPREWIEKVDDNTLGIRAEEASGYYRILAHVSRLDEEFLRKQSRRDVLHVNLIRDPEMYRGLPVFIHGTARRIMPIDVNENEFGIEEAYEVWLMTADSGNDPWRVVTTHLDPRLPLGENVAVSVELTGYFFKQYSYASQGGMHVAPLLLASLVEPRIARELPPSGTGLEPYILLLAGVVGFGTLFSVFLYTRGDRRFKQQMMQQFPIQDEAACELLEKLPEQKSESSLFQP